MANLSLPEVLNLLERPNNGASIERSRKHNERLRLHVDAAQDEKEVSPAYKTVLDGIEARLPAEKFKQFKQALEFPLPTVEFTASIFSELERGLYAENRYFKHEFYTPEFADEFEEYKVKIGCESFWRKEAFEASKNAINSFLIVDLPQETIGERAQPYFYLLDIEHVIDVDVKPDNVAEYIIFRQDAARNKVCVFDDTYFRVLTRPDVDSPYVLTSEVAHSLRTESGELIAGLGYCPARTFWSTRLTKTDKIQRKAPLTGSLGKLDSLLFWETGLINFEATGIYPIYWEYFDKDPKHLNEKGEACQSGKFVHTNIVVVPDLTVPSGKKEFIQTYTTPCGECIKSKYIGPGSVKRVSAPNNSTDADLREPLGIIETPVTSLEHASKRLTERKEEIHRNITGFAGEPGNDAAKNEKQVRSAFESRKNYVIAYKSNFEAADKWILDTLCKLMFGADFIGSTVFYGDEFYLQSAQELDEIYERQKKSGMPQYVLASTRRLRDETKYRTNEDMKLRQRILSELEPFPDVTIDASTISALTPDSIFLRMFPFDSVMLKSNFYNYILKFERENGPVVQWGNLLAYENKISIIQKTLLGYVNTDRESASAQFDRLPIGGTAAKPNGGPETGND